MGTYICNEEKLYMSLPMSYIIPKGDSNARDYFVTSYGTEFDEKRLNSSWVKHPDIITSDVDSTSQVINKIINNTSYSSITIGVIKTASCRGCGNVLLFDHVCLENDLQDIILKVTRILNTIIAPITKPELKPTGNKLLENLITIQTNKINHITDLLKSAKDNRYILMSAEKRRIEGLVANRESEIKKNEGLVSTPERRNRIYHLQDEILALKSELLKYSSLDKDINAREKFIKFNEKIHKVLFNKKQRYLALQKQFK